MDRDGNESDQSHSDALAEARRLASMTLKSFHILPFTASPRNRSRSAGALVQDTIAPANHSSVITNSNASTSVDVRMVFDSHTSSVLDCDAYDDMTETQVRTVLQPQGSSSGLVSTLIDWTLLVTLDDQTDYPESVDRCHSGMLGWRPPPRSALETRSQSRSR